MNNPIVIAIREFFSPLIKQTLKLPAPLAYGSAVLISIFVIVLFGRIIPNNIVWLVGVVVIACLSAFVIADWDTRRYAKNKISSQTGAITPSTPQDSIIPPSEEKVLKLISSAPPPYYDFGFLKEQVISRFGDEVGFLVIQYGSSVRNTSGDREPYDEDYIVLVHGNYFDRDIQKEEIGHIRKPEEHLARPIDIHIRLFDSFLISLIMGKPYEVSIAYDGEVRDHHKLDVEYWTWFKALVRNMIVDTKYLIGRLQYDLGEFRQTYIKARQENFEFVVVIAAYNLVCDHITIKSLQNYPPRVHSSWIYPLSKVDFLIQNLETDEAKTLFNDLVSCFKRDQIPSDWRKFEQKIDRLISII